MRVCYLILAHANPGQFGHTAAALDHQNSAIVVHVDRRVDDAPFRRATIDIDNLIWVKNRAVAYHQGWGIVDATLRALREGREATPAEYFVLLSGDSYPLRSQGYIQSYLQANKGTEWLNVVRFPAPDLDKATRRLSRYYVQHDPRGPRMVTQSARLVGRARPARDFQAVLGSLAPYAGSQWWTLSRTAVDHVLNEAARRPKLMRFLRNTHVPDEHFFQIILANSPLSYRIRPSLMFVDFASQTGPRVISRSHVARWLVDGKATSEDAYGRHDEFLFARKFDASNQDVAQFLRTTLWSVG